MTYPNNLINLTAILDHFTQLREQSRDPVIGKRVKLPTDWQLKTNFQAEWTQDITEGQVEGRVHKLDEHNEAVPTDFISVRLVSPSGQLLEDKIEVNQWDLSLAQKG